MCCWLVWLVLAGGAGVCSAVHTGAALGLTSAYLETQGWGGFWVSPWEVSSSASQDVKLSSASQTSISRLVLSIP